MPPTLANISPPLSLPAAGDAADRLPSLIGGRPWDRRDGLIAATLAAIALATYVATLAPGLLESDSAEFQTLAATLGYAHPTGYPVYVLAAHAAACLPVGDVAYRANLWSAVCAATTVGLLYALTRVLVGRLRAGDRRGRGPGRLAHVLVAGGYRQSLSHGADGDDRRTLMPGALAAAAAIGLAFRRGLLGRHQHRRPLDA